MKYVRSIKQGRKPQGLTRWNGRLTTASLEELKAKAKMLEPYYTVNDLVRIAVDRYVCTELLNPWFGGLFRDLKESEMPNHVTHKVTFEASKADEIFAAVCPNGKFDFKILVPTPLHVYQGGLGREEDADFPINWHTWNTKNWGTKWNCYSQSCGIENGKAFIKFDTAWSIPYPILAAFANKFNIPFEHRYYDEGQNFWGIENWGNDRYDTKDTPVHRVTKRRDNPDDVKLLCIELKGYDPDADDDDAAEQPLAVDNGDSPVLPA